MSAQATTQGERAAPKSTAQTPLQVHSTRSALMPTKEPISNVVTVNGELAQHLRLLGAKGAP